MNIGAAIRDLRKEQGISQKSLASKCNISATSLSQLEKNYKYPHPRNLKTISEQLGTTIAGIYIHAITDEDIPKHKLKVFKAFEPVLRNIFFEK